MKQFVITVIFLMGAAVEAKTCFQCEAGGIPVIGSVESETQQESIRVCRIIKKSWGESEQSCGSSQCVAYTCKKSSQQGQPREREICNTPYEYHDKNGRCVAPGAD